LNFPVSPRRKSPTQKRRPHEGSFSIRAATFQTGPDGSINTPFQRFLAPSSSQKAFAIHQKWIIIGFVNQSRNHVLTAAACLLQISAACLCGQTNQIIYSNTLQNGWSDWSWASDNRANTSPVLPGFSDSISVSCSNWTAFALHQTPFDSTPYASLTFWLNGGPTGGQVLTVTGTLDQVNQTSYTLPALGTNWQQFTVPLAEIGVAGQPDFDGFWIWNYNNFTIPTFYIDDIVLTAAPSTPPPTHGPFIKGCNLAWLDGSYNTWLGLDPTEPGWGIAYNSAHLNSYMASMHSMGITVLRVWVNEGDMGDTIDDNDYVTGVTPTWTSNFANMIQLAANNQIQLYVTLNNGRYDWLQNPAQAAAYLTNALIPMITTYKGNTNIFAIDLMNEIDGVVQGSLGDYTTNGGTWPQAQAYISTFAAAIHNADPTRKVSCSTGWHQWYNLSYFLGLGLDFYDFHNYQDTPSFPLASSLGMDKPIYIGECGQGTQTWDDSIQNTCELDALNSAYSAGYMGVGEWNWEYPGSDDYLAMVNTNGSWRPVDYTIQNWNYGFANSSINASIGLSGTNLLLTWPQGTLLQASNVAGPWVTNPAASPYTVFPTNAGMFYQAQIKANPISINFSGSGTSMGGSESAGVVPETNWNNAVGAGGSGLVLNDSTGNASAGIAAWSANGVNNTSVPDVAGNDRMMRNYLDTGNAATTIFMVNGLPPNTAGWNVYVYFNGSNSATTEGAYTISGPGIATTSIIGIDTANTDFSGTFIQASNSAGNYVQFSIPIVSGFTLSATPLANSAPINGIQIIPK
jgi:hypothetical protein